MKKIIYHHPKYESTVQLTIQQIEELGIDPTSDKQCLDIDLMGVWQIPTRTRGIVVSKDFENYITTIHGIRTMFDVRQGGYELWGRVSVDGEKRKCFTSSILIETPDKHLISVEVIHV